MDYNAVFALTWACIAVFIATAIITLLALVGRVTLGGGDGSKHHFYLNALFAALILEVVGISVAAYASAVKGSPPAQELALYQGIVRDIETYTLRSLKLSINAAETCALRDIGDIVSCKNHAREALKYAQETQQQLETMVRRTK
jgi:hypothetical protein